MDRRYAVYRPSSWRGRRFQPRLFRSLSLNAAGWTAVALLCLAGAGAGYGVGSLGGLPREACLLAGALLGLITLVVLDRRRWGRLETGFSWGNDPDVVVHTGAELQRQGVPVRLKVDHGGRASLRYYNRDARRVWRALARIGVRSRRR